jgi:hemolysin III
MRCGGDHVTGQHQALREASHGPKPLLRGWFHAGGAVAALALTLGLLAQTYGDPPRFAAMLVFGVSMVVLYAVSAVYHLGDWRGRRHTVLRALDHANIFVFIAGAYTPFCAVILTGWMRPAMLVMIWGIALSGTALSVLTLRAPRWLSPLLYVGMGWISLVLLPQIVQTLALTPALLLVAGGLLFTVGAVVYALRWPNPLPRIFGFHEIFHLFVIGGTAAIASVVWVWVVPFTPPGA